MATAAASAAAEDPLVIEAGGCPSASEVKEQLLPLLDEDWIAPAVGPPAERLRVSDFGDRYRIEIGTTVREVADPARDCLERARISAVFMAMNLSLPPAPRADPATTEPLPLTPPTAAPPPMAPPRRRNAAPRYELGASLELLASSRRTAPVPGVRLGLSAHRASWLWFVGTGAAAPSRLELAARVGERGHVELWRAPTQLGGAWLRRGRALEAGPLAALALDLLVFRGRQLPGAESSPRLAAGAMLGLLLRARAGPHVWAFSTLTASVYPAEYRLRVEPLGTVGRAPHGWFGLGLGLAWSPGQGTPSTQSPMRPEGR